MYHRIIAVWNEIGSGFYNMERVLVNGVGTIGGGSLFGSIIGIWLPRVFYDGIVCVYNL